MTDEKYIFKQTEKERKRLARGAFSKVNGSRSKKCTMPSDYMTKGERKKLNGEEKTYNLNKKMSWGEFKKMPLDLQQEYERKLVNEHGARALDIAKMFFISNKTLSNYNTSKGIKAGFTRASRGMSSSWRRFIASESAAVEKVSVPVEEQKAPEEETCAVKQDDLLRLTNGEIYMVGIPGAVFQKMMLLLDNSKQYNFRIGFFEPKEN